MERLTSTNPYKTPLSVLLTTRVLFNPTEVTIDFYRLMYDFLQCVTLIIIIITAITFHLLCAYG